MSHSSHVLARRSFRSAETAFPDGLGTRYRFPKFHGPIHHQTALLEPPPPSFVLAWPCFVSCCRSALSTSAQTWRPAGRPYCPTPSERHIGATYQAISAKT